MARNYFLYLSVALTIAITVGSLVSKPGIGSIDVQYFDKILHFSAYFVLTLSWFLAFKNKFKQLNSFLIIALIVFIYGIIIEVCQMLFTANREADGYDMLANLGGISISLLVFNFIFTKK